MATHAGKNDVYIVDSAVAVHIIFLKVDITLKSFEGLFEHRAFTSLIRCGCAG